MNRPDLFFQGRKSFTDVLVEISESLEKVVQGLAPGKRQREEEEQREFHIVSSSPSGVLRHNEKVVNVPVHELLTTIGGKVVAATDRTWTIEKKVKRVAPTDRTWTIEKKAK